MNWFLGRRKTIHPYHPVKVKCVMCDKEFKVNSNVDGTVPLNRKCDVCRRRYYEI